jgi:hypothetical protein
MSLQAFVDWENKLALRRSAVLFITLWMTWRSFAWAAQYASQVALSGSSEGAVAAAAMIAAVTAPIAYLQKAVFSAYIDSK